MAGIFLPVAVNIREVFVSILVSRICLMDRPFPRIARATAPFTTIAFITIFIIFTITPAITTTITTTAIISRTTTTATTTIVIFRVMIWNKKR